MLWLYALSIPPNSYLFVIRIRAVFRDSRVIQGAFVCVWLAVVAASLHQPFCARFSADCVLGTVRAYCSFGPIAVMVHDTMVVLALSMKLLLYSLASSWRERFRIFFSARGMPHVSTLLLRTGQQYYL